ncbi:MAG: c-type cytochrome [Nitrococcus sp.]|nr:c-type cytochrome [Nitrococcus sp.]
MNRRVLLICLIVVTSAGSAAAADAGKQIVLQGGSNPGATACVTCHGVNGTGNAAAGFPRLAGLSASYLERQLEAFRLGTRTTAVMAPIAKALTGSESASVSEYYAHQHPPAPQTQAPPQQLAAGMRLAITGDWANGIPACVTCHGPAGQGIGGPYFPALAGQHASYTVSQIQAWKDGARTSDPINLMKSVAEALTQEQVEAVAAYFASLPALDKNTSAESVDALAELPPTHAEQTPADHSEGFIPPSEAEIPDNEFGRMVWLGKKVFVHTQQAASKYAGNALNCVNCHLDRGRLASSAPLWGAWPMYPAYRGKNDKVNTMTDRIQGCFTFSMNGSPPPGDSKVMTALLAYSYWLAQGAPTGVALPGSGYPDLPDPELAPSRERGRAVFEGNCALCHGAHGQGKKVDGAYWFPPLWGPDSYNWGAGMHRVNTAASFINANMPLGLGGELLTNQQAWDVAAYIDAHPRPQDPRYENSVEQTDERFHDHNCFYGESGGE